MTAPMVARVAAIRSKDLFTFMITSLADCTVNKLVGALSLVMGPVTSPFLPKSGNSMEISWLAAGPTWKLSRPMFLALTAPGIKPSELILLLFGSTPTTCVVDVKPVVPDTKDMAGLYAADGAVKETPVLEGI